jgi:hypothetical protein
MPSAGWFRPYSKASCRDRLVPALLDGVRDRRGDRDVIEARLQPCSVLEHISHSELIPLHITDLFLDPYLHNILFVRNFDGDTTNVALSQWGSRDAGGELHGGRGA